MKTSFNISPYIKGTLQGRQTPDALATDNFLVDERTKLDWMAYASQVGRVLDFHAVNGSVEGTWESFLLSDVSLLTARIAQTHRVQEYNQFITLYEALKDQEQIHRNKNYLPTLFALGFEVAILIDAWYKMSKQSFAVSSVATFLTERIQTVGITNVSTFYQLYQKLKRKVHFEEPNNLHLLQQLSSVWKFNPLVEIKKQEQNTSEEDLLKLIQKAGQELFQLPSEINRWAAAEFEHSLQRKDMPPHIGLMATFFDLFREQQKAINTITKRHLEFYYQSVLQSQKKPALPDHTIVAVELAKGVEKLTLTKGATISGSTVEGEPVAFQVKEDTGVNAAKIARYFTLNFPCDEVNVGSDAMILGTVSNFNEIGNTSWPIFGGGLSTPNWSPQPFTLGWAFSCSDLLLAQGTRSLTIVFTCKSFEAELSGIDFSSLFEIKLTAKEGWHTAAINQVQYQADGQLKFILNLAPTDPSIIAYDKKIHGTGYDSTWPICAVTLTGRGKQQFDVLSKWSVDKVSVATDVKGVCDFLIENESGKLPNTAPFIPFNEPLPGSNLYIGGQEFFVKCLTQFDITIVWDKLPADFQEYYSAYNTYYQEKGDKKQKASPNPTSGSVQEQPILNQSFKAKVYELNGDSWKAVSKEGNNRVEYCLFTEDPTTSVASAVPQLPLVKNAQKKISLNGPFRFNPQLPVYTALNNNLREGFFCLSLSSPSQGFGSVDYPIIVSSVTLDNSAALMHNARLVKLHKLPIKPLPAIPYVPKMKGMEVDYQSTQSYPLDATSNFVKWYHLHPFGIEPVPFHEELPKLLPTYPAQAYAYWGVELLAPNNHLSVLITVESKSKSIHKASPDDFIFEYRSAHGWRKMLVVSDGTEGFQRSGEIRLSIPTDIVKGGINLPESFYWLRCGQTVYSKIDTHFLSTQALSLVRVESGQEQQEPIHAGAIAQLTASIPGIKTFLQPLPVSGGRPVLTDQQHFGAVSGRLRHKRRAITLSDIETILLDEFPALYKVTVLPLSYAQPAERGLVKVIVTPYTNFQQSDCYYPIASHELMLNVFDFLQNIGLPSVRYEVSNPDFIELKVSCQVQFKQSNQEQALANQLIQELNQFLSPWIKGNKTSYAATEKLSGSMLYSFIQSRSYVQKIEDFAFYLFGSSDQATQDVIAVSPLAFIIPDQHHSIYSGIPSASQSEDEGLRIGETFYVNP